MTEIQQTPAPAPAPTLATVTLLPTARPAEEAADTAVLDSARQVLTDLTGPAPLAPVEKVDLDTFDDAPLLPAWMKSPEGWAAYSRRLLPGPPQGLSPLGPAPAHRPWPRPPVRPGYPPRTRVGRRLRGRPRPGRRAHRARPDPRGPGRRPLRPLHPAYHGLQEGAGDEDGREAPEGRRAGGRAAQEGAQGPQPGEEPAGRGRLRPAAHRDRRRVRRHRLARCGHAALSPRSRAVRSPDASRTRRRPTGRPTGARSVTATG